MVEGNTMFGISPTKLTVWLKLVVVFGGAVAVLWGVIAFVSRDSVAEALGPYPTTIEVETLVHTKLQEYSIEATENLEKIDERLDKIDQNQAVQGVMLQLMYQQQAGRAPDMAAIEARAAEQE